MTEYSRVPKVPRAELTGTRWYWYSEDLWATDYQYVRKHSVMCLRVCTPWKIDAAVVYCLLPLRDWYLPRTAAVFRDCLQERHPDTHYAPIRTM